MANVGTMVRQSTRGRSRPYRASGSGETVSTSGEGTASSSRTDAAASGDDLAGDTASAVSSLSGWFARASLRSASSVRSSRSGVIETHPLLHRPPVGAFFRSFERRHGEPIELTAHRVLGRHDLAVGSFRTEARVHTNPCG